MFALPRLATVLQEGDSLFDDAFYRIVANLRLLCMAAYTRPVPISTTRDRPVWRNCAVSGSTSTSMLARVGAEITASSPTHFICNGWVNDCQTGVNIAAVTLPNTSAILALLPATCQILWLGPLCWGEKWPSGQNASPTIDQAIVDCDAGVQAILASQAYAARSTFISLRHAVYDVQEPVLNTPGPGTLTGPLTRPDTQGAHPNATGVNCIMQQVLQNVTFSP